MTILEQIYCLIFRNLTGWDHFFIRYVPKKGQIVPRPDGRQYALPITRNHTMITDISASVLHRTSGWSVFVTIVVAVCIPVCSSYAHSMIVVDREWYVWLNYFLYIPNAPKKLLMVWQNNMYLNYKTPNYPEYR